MKYRFRSYTLSYHQRRIFAKSIVKGSVISEHVKFMKLCIEPQPFGKLEIVQEESSET